MFSSPHGNAVRTSLQAAPPVNFAIENEPLPV
jgi:hypothetical protein